MNVCVIGRMKVVVKIALSWSRKTTIQVSVYLVFASMYVGIFI